MLTANRSSVMHVAAAAIFNETGEVLVALRPDYLHQGGLWEFPGGKVEPGEEVPQALARELHEELGITARAARPLIRVYHNYEDRSVLLDVWRISAFAGEPQGREGQPVEWVVPDQLTKRQFPEANLPVISAVRLPPVYLITGEPQTSEAEFLARLERAVAAGVRLVQLRAKGLAREAYRQLAGRAVDVCRNYDAALLLNAESALAVELGAGVHLTSARLMALSARPLPAERWVAASCHTLAELEHACRIGVDFVVVSPVLPTTSHPEAAPLGWEGLWEFTERSRLPVYALGGMMPDHLAEAFRYGAQGIATIGALWDAADIEQAVRRCQNAED